MHRTQRASIRSNKAVSEVFVASEFCAKASLVQQSEDEVCFLTRRRVTASSRSRSVLLLRLII